MLERKEKEQVDIENELDFLLSQQKELEDCLVPLEQELQSAEVLSSMNNEREPMYVNESYFIIMLVIAIVIWFSFFFQIQSCSRNW